MSYSCQRGGQSVREFGSWEYQSEKLLSRIPQRLYCQGILPHGAASQRITFAMADGRCFPAELALVGQCNRLVDGDDTVFAEHHQTINMRIEVFGLFVDSGLLIVHFYVYSGRGTMGGGRR